MDDKPHRDLDDRLKALDQHIKSLSKHLHTPAKAKGEDAICHIPCPSCGSQMESGKLRLHAGLLTLAVFPYGEHCWFQPDGRGEERKVLDTAQHRQAFQCSKCKTVLLPGK